ncbi:MAG: DNA polymerase III subunit gamma/tau [Solobacterium sp.]|nr:DNA polymerase III subunit gamma/tau [Solobacterium sp.]
MSKLALYQKYRSSTFDEVVGQEHVVRSIKNAILQNKVSHAYLFCGPRGTGKTTMARLLAKAVNCENPEEAPCGHCASCIAANEGSHPDIIEINGASETHVEDVRGLIERARLAPMQGKNKIYIIDEVHQLSSAACSALLKTLEEPPENVIFILATTDPQKLLPTIISRCQRYDFTKLNKTGITNHLLNIAQSENIKMEAKAAEMIADLADGGMRDALSIMDQCASYTGDNITEEEVTRIYGLASTEEKVELLKDILKKNIEGILVRTEQYAMQGIDLQRFTDDLITIAKDCAIYAQTDKAELMKLLNVEQVNSILENTDGKTCLHIAEVLLDSRNKYSYSSSAISCFEVICLGLTMLEEKHASMNIVETKKPTQKPSNTVDKETTKEETKPNKLEVIHEAKELSEEEILSLLVQCNKEEKAIDEEKIKKVHTIFDLEKVKYTDLLTAASIAASGKDCLLLKVKNSSLEHAMNDEQLNRELYRFATDDLDINKMIYVLTEDRFKKATDAYRKLMAEKKLPKAMKIKRYEREKEKPVANEEKVIALFGAENVEIVEEN